MRVAEPRPYGRGYALSALQASPSLGTERSDSVTELERAESPAEDSHARQGVGWDTDNMRAESPALDRRFGINFSYLLPAGPVFWRAFGPK